MRATGLRLSMMLVIFLMYLTSDQCHHVGDHLVDRQVDDRVVLVVMIVITTTLTNHYQE